MRRKKDRRIIDNVTFLEFEIFVLLIVTEHSTFSFLIISPALSEYHGLADFLIDCCNSCFLLSDSSCVVDCGSLERSGKGPNKMEKISK